MFWENADDESGSPIKYEASSRMKQSVEVPVGGAVAHPASDTELRERAGNCPPYRDDAAQRGNKI